MTNRKIISLFFCCLFCFAIPNILEAQEVVEINGVVLEKGTSIRIAQVNVRNMRTKKVVSTDNMGLFRITVQVGDTLIFTKIGYQSHQTEIKTFSDILIDMEASTIRLADVNIKGKSREEELREGIEGFKRQGIYAEGKPSLLYHIFSPLTALYERFSRTGKNARRYNNFMNREMQEIQIDRLFSKYKVQELTQLEGEDLENFMFWYRPSFEAAQYWNEYDITNHIMKSFKKFETDGRPKKPRLSDLGVPKIQ